VSETYNKNLVTILYESKEVVRHVVGRGGGLFPIWGEGTILCGPPNMP